MTIADFVKYVDAFLSAPKALVGLNAAQWAPGPYDGSQRVKLPIEIDGEQRGESLIVDAYPDADPPHFHILIEIGSAVSRLDHGAGESHANDFAGQALGLPSLVNGPHFHSWADNRHAIGSPSHPFKLPYARPLDVQIRRFDATLRWFCDQNGILVDYAITLDLPPKLRLI